MVRDCCSWVKIFDKDTEQQSRDFCLTGSYSLIGLYSVEHIIRNLFFAVRVFL